jgi:putative SOS response-associated peptidase YedK
MAQQPVDLMPPVLLTEEQRDWLRTTQLRVRRLRTTDAKGYFLRASPRGV